MLFNLQKSISARIIAGYSLIIVLGLITTIFCIVSINKNQKIDKEVSEVYYPLSLALKDYGSIAIETNRLVNNWIYQPSKNEKQQLSNILKVKFPEFKSKLDKLSLKIEDDSLKKGLLALNKDYLAISNDVFKIVSRLNADSAYSNDVLIDECISILESNITPSIFIFNKNLENLENLEKNLLDQIKEKKRKTFRWLSYLFVGTMILFLLIAFFSSYYSTTSIVKPVLDLKNKMDELALGKLIDYNELNSKDEIGQMSKSIAKVINGLKIKAKYASVIGQGQYDKSFELLSEEDVMGQAILKMRDNLKIAAINEQNRSWSNVGIAKMADILRGNLKSEELYYQIISFTVKYMEANQGGLFILEKTTDEEEKLLLKACYAYDRKKHFEKEILKGEGLVGQCYLEGETIFLTDIPDEYINITSGLGARNPNCLVIVPLKINDQIYGIMEIASFKIFEPHHIQFLEKISENIASGISSIVLNEKTITLLKNSQEQTELLRTQEEEIRQNLEELSASQEEMQRQLIQTNEIKDLLEIRENVINTTTILSESDIFGNILFVNDKLCEVSKYNKEELLGKPHSIFRHQDMPKALFEIFWDTIKAGDVFKGIIKNKAKDGTHYWVDATVVPIKDNNGVIIKYVSARYHLVEDKIAEILYKEMINKFNIEG